tara:strand:+ start:448 stop:699 length:252 start_codon:yes stop_codon:yes gene_type:complete
VIFKIKVFLILLALAGCTVHFEEEYIPCGYDETPYYSEPDECVGPCCIWHAEDIYYYSECAEVWCYEENACAWQLYEYSCYAI